MGYSFPAQEQSRSRRLGEALRQCKPGRYNSRPALERTEQVAKVRAAVIKDNVYTGEFEEIEVETVDPNAQYIIEDKRASTGGRVDPEPQEVNGSVNGFIPAGDYVLIRRLKTVEQGLIARPEAYSELAERGIVISTSSKAANEVPLDSTAKFSKYGAEEIHFDDEADDSYVLVRLPDVRGWHLAGR